MSWERTYAVWRRLNRRDLVAGPANLANETTLAMADDLRRHLRDAGWRTEDLNRPLAPPITLQMTDSHADFFLTNTVVLLAETRALQLLHPNPMPDLRWRFRRK